MSFKVYNGVKVDGIKTLDDTFKFIETARDVVLQSVESTVANNIKRLACLTYDKYHVLGINMLVDNEDVSHDNPLLSATMENLRYQESLKHDESRYSLGIGSYNGITVALPFFGDRNADDAFLELPNVSEFGYWDNTDPLETVSEKEWDKRKNIWNAVLHTSGIPSQTMLIVVLVDALYIVPRDKYMVDLPTPEERLSILAMDKAYPIAKSQLEESEHSNFYKIHTIAKKLSIDIKKELEGKLNKDLTLKDLEQPLITGE